MQQASSLDGRRADVAAAWSLARGAVVVPSGIHVPIQGTDQFHEFHAHPEFAYLAGAPTPGAVLVFDPAEGWAVFAPVASLEDRVWVGDGVDHAELGQRIGLPVRPLAEFRTLDRASPERTGRHPRKSRHRAPFAGVWGRQLGISRTGNR
ncbi:MAG: aminopeptidase P N-terminal domain-containing protein [Dehalococcoidia bacterium]|nr:aminopeptidase P N-terminal domain-containing protein [Dehalococcoidia bacterium]